MKQRLIFFTLFLITMPLIMVWLMVCFVAIPFFILRWIVTGKECFDIIFEKGVGIWLVELPYKISGVEL